MAEADAIADQMIECNPSALRTIKRVVRWGGDMPADHAEKLAMIATEAEAASGVGGRRGPGDRPSRLSGDGADHPAGGPGRRVLPARRGVGRLPSLDLLATGPGLVDGTVGTRLAPAALDERVGALAAGLLGCRGARRAMPSRGSCPTVRRSSRCTGRAGGSAPWPHPSTTAQGPPRSTPPSPRCTRWCRSTARTTWPGWPPPATGSAVPAGGVDVDPSSVAAVLFTAGSTGRPKAVLHTHRTLGYKARSMVGVHGLGPADVMLMPAPMAHISGLQNGILVPAAAGMTTVTMASWDPDHALSLVEDEHVSFMVGPPTFFVGMRDAARFDPSRVASLRLVSSGGTGVTPAFVEPTADAFGCTVKRTYGSTEAPTVTTSYTGDPADRARDTDGRPTGGAEVRIADGGEVWVRGPEVCQGYASVDDIARRFTADGWLRTGDLGTLDDGWLTITGSAERRHHPGRREHRRRRGRGRARGPSRRAPGRRRRVPRRPPRRTGVRLRRGGAGRLVRAGRGPRRGSRPGASPATSGPSASRSLAALPLLAAGKPDRGLLRDPGGARPLIGQGPAAGGRSMAARASTSGVLGTVMKPRWGRSRSNDTNRMTITTAAARSDVMTLRPRMAR